MIVSAAIESGDAQASINAILAAAEQTDLACTVSLHLILRTPSYASVSHFVGNCLHTPEQFRRELGQDSSARIFSCTC